MLRTNHGPFMCSWPIGEAHQHFRDHSVGTYHKPYNNISSHLGHPKDKTPDPQKCGVVYEIKCPDCDESYVGETARAMSTRLKEHVSLSNPQTAIAEHRTSEGYNIQMRTLKSSAGKTTYGEGRSRIDRDPHQETRTQPRPGVWPPEDLRSAATVMWRTERFPPQAWWRAHDGSATSLFAKLQSSER